MTTDDTRPDPLAALRERVQRFETGRNDEADTYYRAATDRSWLLGRLDDERAVLRALAAPAEGLRQAAKAWADAEDQMARCLMRPYLTGYDDAVEAQAAAALALRAALKGEPR
jgi:hypothetical protein